MQQHGLLRPGWLLRPLLADRAVLPATNVSCGARQPQHAESMQQVHVQDQVTWSLEEAETLTLRWAAGGEAFHWAGCAVWRLAGRQHHKAVPPRPPTAVWRVRPIKAKMARAARLTHDTPALLHPWVVPRMLSGAALTGDGGPHVQAEVPLTRIIVALGLCDEGGLTEPCLARHW